MRLVTRLLLVLVLTLSLLTASSAEVGPIGVDVSLHAGESLVVETWVTTETSLPPVDVVISMDLTASMGDRLGNLQAELGKLISTLSAAPMDVNVGVVSHEDYSIYTSSCGYSAQYGESGEAPFRVDYAVGADLTAAADVVKNSMDVKSQQDSPEPYARVMWESGQSDSGIGYRADAQKTLLMVVDDEPHDCARGTGPDPGRDLVAGTSDDIHFLSDDKHPEMVAVTSMKDAGVRLLVLSCGSTTALWEGIAAQIGGTAIQINEDGSLPEGLDIAQLILGPVGKAESQAQTDVSWSAQCDPGLTVTLSPEVHHSVPEGATVYFDEAIGVPAGTAAGEYGCTVTFHGDEGLSGRAVIGTQTIRVTVPEPEPAQIAIEIDIRPGSYPNTINPRSKGVIPVAILGSQEVDVLHIDVETLAFGPDEATPVHDLTHPGIREGHTEDTNQDGYPDMVTHYRQEETGPPSGDAELCLTGKMDDGRVFDACDSVRVVGK